LSFLGPEYSWATQTSAGDFMKAIITVSANASQNEQTCIGPNELTRQLVSKPCVEQLIKYMLGGGNPLTVGVGIVIEVIRKNNSDYDPDGPETNTVPSSRDPIYLGTLLRMFAEHVPDFMNLVMNAPAQKQRIDSTFGYKIEPLGFDRFKTCELMAELLHCSNMGLLNEVGSEELIAARDTERQRLRADGKLTTMRGEEPPSSVDDLTMHSHSSPIAEGRRLEVTNISAEDDGFEEVMHNGDEDTSHGVEDIPDLPDFSGAGQAAPTASCMDKDEEDFVDEPLSSPRLNFAELDAADKLLDNSFEDPDLIVAPLSPSKAKTVEPADAQGTEAVAQTDKPAVLQGEASTSDETKLDDTAVSDTTESSQGLATPTSTLPDVEEATTEDAPHTPGKDNSARVQSLSPRPEDTPAPLFSPRAEVHELETTPATESKPESEETTPPVEPAGSEPGQASIVIAVNDEPTLPQETTLTPVVGDYLKMQFVEHRVVPTILTFFFEFPWNNFLHNVVYDIVQQVFNGPMDRGYNATLAISLFEVADVTAQIINGQLVSEESQTMNKTRMGYMGHLTLIAEEVVKFTERHPPELLSEIVLDKVMAQDWINYVEGPLAETRERDNALLGGVRPEVAMSNRAGASSLGGVGLSGLGSIGLGGASGSSALAEAGLNGSSDAQDGSSGNGLGPFPISAGTLLSGFGSSSDEEDDEEQESEEDVNNEVSDILSGLLLGVHVNFVDIYIPPLQASDFFGRLVFSHPLLLAC
jgi:SIT4-associating protein SAP185/190